MIPFEGSVPSYFFQGFYFSVKGLQALKPPKYYAYAYNQYYELSLDHCNLQIHEQSILHHDKIVWFKILRSVSKCKTNLSEQK